MASPEAGRWLRRSSLPPAGQEIYSNSSAVFQVAAAAEIAAITRRSIFLVACSSDGIANAERQHFAGAPWLLNF
jgi:hypothetical protein